MNKYVYYDKLKVSVYSIFQYEKFNEEQKSKLIQIDEEFWNNLVEQANNNNMIIINGPDDMPELSVFVPSQYDLLMQELSTLKQYLIDTDYTVIKCQELGLVYVDTYPEVAVERTHARDRINELEAFL